MLKCFFSLRRAFKSTVLKWTVLLLARSYMCCPPGVQTAVEQLTSFLLHTHCFRYIHDVPEHYCYTPGCKIYFNRCIAKKEIFPAIFSDTVCLAFFHNYRCGNVETWLTKYIRKALNTLLTILQVMWQLAKRRSQLPMENEQLLHSQAVGFF